VALARSWRSITLGFLPITVLTVFMLIATIPHWDRFNHEHVAFFGWTSLYVVTPVLVPTLWLYNRKADPGLRVREAWQPPGARAVVGATGVAICLLALVMFLSPAAVADDWPWRLTPLTTRVTAGFLALTGCSLVAIAVDSRWPAARLLIETLILGSALIIAAIPRAWDTLDPSLTVRWAYLLALIVGLMLLLPFYFWMEYQARQRTTIQAEAGA
jgi:hypothetical protein